MKDKLENIDLVISGMQQLKARKNTLLALIARGARVAILRQKAHRRKLPKLHTWEVRWVDVLDTMDVNKYNRHSKLALVVPPDHQIPEVAHFVSKVSCILDYNNQLVYFTRINNAFPTPAPAHISRLEIMLNRYCKPNPVNYFSGSKAMLDSNNVVFSTKSPSPQRNIQVMGRLKKRTGEAGNYELAPLDVAFKSPD